jgi:hypothetical protein
VRPPSPDGTVQKAVEADPRQLDILFMVDNTASMEPNQHALSVAFPRLIEELQNLPGGMPDVHIGVVSSDMGAGGGERPNSDCNTALGNQGILWGNDPNGGLFGEDKTSPTVRNIKNGAGDYGCGMNSGAHWIEDSGSSEGGSRQQNYRGDLTDVFSCLAKAVGTRGCGFEHQLQSVRVALNPILREPDRPGHPAINPQNVGFLRPNAYLAVVIISDEDDCSADPSKDENDEIFVPEMTTETGSLRCAARGHVCNGRSIPDYDPQSGYMGQGFSANFANCDAKDSSDRHELPLIRVRDMIDSVNQVKPQPEEQIMGFGIIGWPQGGTLDGVEYRIGKDSTSMPVEQQKLWDYMPVCVVRDQKSADGNLYKGYGSFRIKKFLDAFRRPTETNVLSICDLSNFTDGLRQLGRLLAGRLGNSERKP